MAELDRELNNQVARGRLKALLECGAPIVVHANAGEGGGASPWLRRAMGAIALTVAGAAAGAQMPSDKLRDMAEAKNLQPVKVMIAGKAYEALHPMERVRLCKEIASQQRLHLFGLDWRDIYAVVQAESGWASRDGMGLNGKPSFGIAQMEEATAKSLGINPADQRDALLGVSRLLKEASAWARARGHADKRMALSVYYNLSTKARNAWDGESLHVLPVPTQNHVRNLRDGHKIATSLAPKYEKFVLVAQKAIQSQNAVREDLESQRAHIASLPVMGFEGEDGIRLKARVSDLLAGRHKAPAAEHVMAVADAGSMSVLMRMKGFPGSALRPSEDLARRAQNQQVMTLRHQGLERLADAMSLMSASAGDVIAMVRSRLLSSPSSLAQGAQPISTEFPTLTKAVASFGSLTSLLRDKSAADLVGADRGDLVKMRASTLDARLEVEPEIRLLKDVQVATAAPDALRNQQVTMSDILQRLASQATNSAVRYALNEQGRMVAYAATRGSSERHVAA